MSLQEKLQHIRDLLPLLKEKQQAELRALAKDWSVRCRYFQSPKSVVKHFYRNCETLLCDLSFLHLYYAPNQKNYFLVSDKNEWRARVSSKKRADSTRNAVVAYIYCDCSSKFGKLMKYRGKISCQW